MFEYPQEFLENNSSINKDHNLRILHGPFSPLHVESKPSQDAQTVTISSDTDETVYIPRTDEIEREKLLKNLKQEISGLQDEKKAGVIGAINNMISRYGEQTYGEYLPRTYSSNTNDLIGSDEENLDGKSLHPVLFISNFLLKEAKNGEIRKEIVLHPDTIFFLSRGKREELKASLDFLNEMASQLDVQLYFENIQLANPRMQKVFSMFIDPFQLSNMIRDYEKLGIAVDIKHMERHFLPESIENNIVSAINAIGHPSKVLIHSRKGLEQKYPNTYQRCVRSGIPWVVEE